MQIENATEFVGFPKISRLSSPCVITEKIDGTNAQINIAEDGELIAGSKNRVVVPGDDNYGFAAWAHANKEALIKELGPGRHFGEWWGSGIQSGYGLPKGERHFSLFNTTRWQNADLKLCRVTPVLYEDEFYLDAVEDALNRLRESGSFAAPGFMEPEGVIVYFKHNNTLFKAYC